MPERYANNFYDYVLRAKGFVSASMQLAILKVLIGVLTALLGAMLFGLWGGVFAAAFTSVISGEAYKRRARGLFRITKTGRKGAAWSEIR